jgi:hypothetical protein
LTFFHPDHELFGAKGFAMLVAASDRTRAVDLTMMKKWLQKRLDADVLVLVQEVLDKSKYTTET